MARRDASFASPLRGEVGANAPGEGIGAFVLLAPSANAGALTPALSPQGREGDGAVGTVERETINVAA
jgi:hypothetical protein